MVSAEVFEAMVLSVRVDDHSHDSQREAGNIVEGQAEIDGEA